MLRLLPPFSSAPAFCVGTGVLAGEVSKRPPHAVTMLKFYAKVHLCCQVCGRSVWNPGCALGGGLVKWVFCLHFPGIFPEGRGNNFTCVNSSPCPCGILETIPLSCDVPKPLSLNVDRIAGMYCTHLWWHGEGGGEGRRAVG